MAVPNGQIALRTPVLWTIGSGVTLAVGGVTRIMVSRLHPDGPDTYFIVMHLEYLLGLSILFGFFAAWYHWFPKLTGYAYSDMLGRTHLWLLCIGVIVMVLPQILLFAHVADVADLVRSGNRASWIGGTISAASTLVFLANMGLSFLRRRPAG